MNKQDRINAINDVLKEFFADSSNPRCIKPKVLMEILVQKGIYNKKDQRGGLPLRNLLRELNEENILKAIPYLYVEKKEKNIYWFFIDKLLIPKTILYLPNWNLQDNLWLRPIKKVMEDVSILMNTMLLDYVMRFLKEKRLDSTASLF